MIVPVYLSFIITVFLLLLLLLCVFRIFDKKLLKAVLLLVVLAGFVIGSYSYIMTTVIEEMYKDYKASVPFPVTKENLENDKEIGDVYDSAYRFSAISDNGVYSLNKTEKIIVDADQGNYNIKDNENLKK